MGVRTETEGSDLVDPLADYSSLSLFPRTFSSLSTSSSSSIDLRKPNSPILNSILTHLKAKVLSSPDKMLKQAKPILEDSLNFLKTDKTEAIAENEKVPRERRPALGLKRAKFSAKPMPSQPDASLEFSIDVDKLSDPEELFSAFERMENAKKEVQRLRGEPLFDLDQNRASLARRPRRPSLLGRSSTYTHRPYSSKSMADVDETLLPSQETIYDEILSPTRDDVLPHANVVNHSPSVILSDSKSRTTSKVSEFDELLSSNYEGLDEDEVENLLRDKLQIKPVEIGKAALPNWRVQLRESMTSSLALPKVNNMVSHRSAARKAVRSSDKVSPAKSQSPLASISLLNRHIAKRTPSKDPFSPIHINSSPAEATIPAREPENRADQAGESDEIDARKNSCAFSTSPAHGEENIAVSIQDSFVSMEKDVDTSSEPNEKEDLIGQLDQIGNKKDLCEFGRSPVHEEESVAVSGQDSLALASKNVVPTNEPEKQDDEQDVPAAELPVRQLLFEGLDMEEPTSGGGEGVHLGELVEKGGTCEPSTRENCSVEELNVSVEELNVSVEEPTTERVASSKRKSKELGISTAPSEAGVFEEGMQAEKSQSDALVSSEGRSKKRKVQGAQPRRSKRDLQQRRTSLYCAGTKWEAGVRRSTRIKMRPLQYWKGERFLYGRVHESLVTVIGVKYASPSKDTEEAGVKVKSFVSDKYKDMVEFASLH
ncbi:centromere protein C isoform X1 [Beta vulgaris subsp. vulgaris]|uniref:centromere protein C isoform X1 n=1 Tax=Beta vulgaris subsp. vulgaris TaxID=3555 RepID=UPI0020374BFC|nr:centromere protein C isoform X1 [Beta vulgaris subsp. vulgaris]